MYLNFDWKNSNEIKMRKINKLTPLPHFNGLNYKGSCLTWKGFHNRYADIYQDTRWQIIIDEQFQQCGYTELYIENLEDSHIDHYKKREHFPNLTFDWSNLIVATKDNNFGANYKDSTYKIGVKEYPLIFNPIIDSVENNFYYDELGMIREDSGKVHKTVEVFNLNDEYLVQRRKKIINLIDNFKEGGLSLLEIKETLDDYGFKSVVNQYCS